MQEQLASADRVCALLDEPEETEGTKTEPLTRSPAAACKDLYFSYHSEIPLFTGLNEEFPAGRSTALAGSSGSGKSTLAHMLLRFRDPQRGSVEIFGRDTRDYTLKSLRSLTAYVPQNPQLFDSSIWENIRLGRPDASDSDILHAAQLARVDAFINELPDGYQTRAGERGTQLSGGQRQRVALARDLLKNAPIILLDEATAALDNKFEHDIHAALADLPKDQTVITIVHRLSTATGNDRIDVFENGRVIESGPHDKLLEKHGKYWQLWNANKSQTAE